MGDLQIVAVGTTGGMDRVSANPKPVPLQVGAIVRVPAPDGVRRPVQFRKYTVFPGDTLESIADLFYGKRVWRKIRAANTRLLRRASDLRPGMVINVPV